MPCPYYHSELLNSLINKLAKVDTDLYFVTIQPPQSEKVFTEQEGIKYVNKIFSNNIKAVIQYERNDTVTHHSKKVRSSKFLNTLHIHLFVSKQYLSNIDEIRYYKDSKELPKKGGIHITATPLKTKERTIYYLTKQYQQNLLPFIHSAFLNIETIYSMKTKQLINPITLLQLFISGKTYSQASKTRYYQLKEAIKKGAIMYLKKHIKAKKNLIIIGKKHYITPYNIGVKPKPPPCTRTFYI